MMWFVGRLITGGLATCRMTVLRGKWRAMVGRPLPATDAPAVPRAVANDRTGILGSSGGGVSQASMAAWSPAEGYVSFRSRAVVNGTSGKNFGGGICGGASGGERALWGGRTFIRVRRRTEQGAEATADGPGFRVDSLGAAVVGRNLFWGGWGSVWAPFGVLTALGLVVLYLCFPTVSSPRSCSPGESWARRWRGGRQGGGDGGLVCDPPTAHWRGGGRDVLHGCRSTPISSPG